MVGEVVFPDSDAVSGGASAPFGAGLGSPAADAARAADGGGAGPQPVAGRAVRHDSPERRAGVAVVPIYDVDAAVAEIRRARESGLWGGILIPSMWQPYPPYYDERYDPVWAACEELDMPVHVHSGAAPREDFGEHVGLYVAEVRFWCRRSHCGS